jgi:DNA topoisomerase-3
MQLVIAEKPSVAQNIAKVLGVTAHKDGYLENDKYIISWCIGHLVELDMPLSYGEQFKSWASLPIIPSEWHYSVKTATLKQYNTLKNLLNDNRVDSVVCATDAGREGELIFRHVYNMSGCNKPFLRLWISSMEDSAIKQGFANLKQGSDYDNLYMSALCRERADWLVGINATRHYTNIYGSLLNIGRVQTPTLAMIVERDRQIAEFKKEKYYTVEIDCGDFKAESDRFTEQPKAELLKIACNNATAIVASVVNEEKHINPPKLYDLTTLQREANKLFGYTAQQTLEAAQSLYDKKLATYPRTDSRYLTEDMEATARELINTISDVIPEFGVIESENANIKPVMNNKKVSDHHAIIPTQSIKNADFGTLSSTDRNILYLISNRLLTATSSKYIYELTSVVISCGGSDFKAKGKVTKAIGWKKLEADFMNFIRCKESIDESIIHLPELYEGQGFDNIKSSISEHFTAPPKPYTEDTLLSAMERAGNEDYDTDDVERKGLGTPATRASIIEKIIKSGFAERNSKQILSTSAGQNLIKVVPERIKSAKMTAEWENRLVLISKGQTDSNSFMNDIEAYVKNIIATTVKNDTVASAFDAQKPSNNHTSLGVCPNCGNEVKSGKFGFYCSGKCGMNISKVFGKELTETQLKKLLSGQEISFTYNKKKTTVQPQAVSYSYTDKGGKEHNGFQWKTKPVKATE